MKLIDCAQGSREWFQSRAGRVTASEVAKTVSFLKRGDKKGEETQARSDYKAQIITEILTGEPVMDGYLSRFMEWGTSNEDGARTAYEVERSVLTDRVGFAIHPTIERAGSSPDGLLGDDGMIEIKCPKTETHLRYILADVVPEDYKPQMYWNMVCCERAWADFVSFDPRLPDVLQLFIKRLPRDEQKIVELEAGVRVFLAEVDQTIAALKAKVGDFTIAQPRKEPTADEMRAALMNDMTEVMP
jgi:hypothetical protein